MNTVINWFEIPVDNLERAIIFYHHALEIDFRREHVAGIDMAIFPHDKPATGGALVKGEMFTPSHTGAVVYLYTANIEKTLLRIGEAGGKTVFGPEVLPDNIGTIALIIDSEGNCVGLHQPA